MTVLEEMLNRFENNLIDKSNRTYQKLREPNSPVQKRIHDGAKLKVYNRVLSEFKQLKERLLKHTEYKGSDPNYLLMPTNAAAGLYFAKQKRKEEDEKMQNLA